MSGTATAGVVAVVALRAAGADVSAQISFGNPSPTAGTSTSQKANAAADQTIYQPVIYTNAGKKGPALSRGDRVQIKQSYNRVLLVKNQKADFFGILRAKLRWGER